MAIAYNTSIVRDGLLLHLDAANRKSWSPNVHPKPLDIYAWSGAGSNNATISRDTTITDSPVGGVPLKMVVIGTDPHITTTTTYIAPAANGQTWTISVYAKASVATTGELFILGLNSSNNYIEAPSGTISITTNWQRFSFTTTFSNASTVGVAIRLDGPNAGGASTIWWDGLQLERASSASAFSSITNTNGTSWFDASGNGNNFTVFGNPTYNTNSITFPNTNSAYLNAANPSNFRMGVQNFTLSCWIKQLDNGANVLLEARGSSFFGYLWVLNYPSVGQISVFLNYGGTQYTYTSSIATLPSGSIQNIIAVIDRSNTQILFYVNGSLWNTVTGIHAGDISPSSGDLYRIGYDAGGSTQNYELYAHAHYNRALSSAEVAQNFNAYRDRYGV